MPRHPARKKYLQRLFTLSLALAAFMSWQAVSAFAACDVPSFHLENSYLAGSSRAVVRDFNNDGKLDVATNGANSNINILLGNGAGGLSAPVSYPVGFPSTTLASADFNGDGKLDIAVLSVRQSGEMNQIDVSILTGDGMGGFSAPTGYSVANVNFPYATSESLSVADFNGDGKPDVAVGIHNSVSQAYIATLLNNGSGGLLAPMNTPVSPHGIINPMIAGDFNGDGKNDLITGIEVSLGSGTDQVWLLLGNGLGGFSAPASLTNTDGRDFLSLSTGDFNNDGKLDVVVALNGAQSRILLGNGSGGFTVVTLTTVGGPGSTIADFNGDGKLDVIIGKYIELGDGLGGFRAGGTLPDFGDFKVYSGDFNSDGRLDVLTVTNVVAVFTNQCGALTARSDYDGDGKADIAVWRPSNGYWFYRRSSDGVVVTSQWGLGSLGDLPVPGNYDNDAKTDLAVFRTSTGAWYILNSSDGSARGLYWGQSGDKPVPADYDGDGKTDIAVYRPSNGYWYVLKSSDNSFYAQPFGVSEDRPVPADYDGDGKADVAVYRPSQGNWYISQSSDNAFVYYHWGLSTDIPAPADYDGDGKAEITVFRQSNGMWITRNQDGSAAFYPSNMSGSETLPQPATYNGGAYQWVAWRSSNGRWWDGQSFGFSFTLGTTGDIPVSSLIGLNQ